MRQAPRAEARAAVRFETASGEQIQIGFGHERQTAWFEGLESIFAAFGGLPETVLLDNARALVLTALREDVPAVVHPRLLAFARHWGFRPVACAPYRARTKGKNGRGVATWRRMPSRAMTSRASRRLRPSGGVDARRRRRAGARHDGRGAAPALPP